ncbi:MAG: nucleotidyltransferase domain-containing protein [Deltaproteobacteria bacterium]|nr:nucleotidyltransferase domain-containing protein [Deltaproteobacteria bacterium]
MSTKAITRKKTNPGPVPGTQSPDLSWYTDVASKHKRVVHIKKLCARIAHEFKPEKIILFGSQAYGNPTSDSDIDLLIVMPYSGTALHKAGEILSHLQVWMPVDVIVRSAEDIKKRLSLGDRFMREVLERGKIMYEAADD